MIQIHSHGPLILKTNYWGSALDRAGALYLSCNAGAFRLLLPTGWEDAVTEMQTGKMVVVSRGPWIQDPGRGKDSLELLFDDGTPDPYAVHIQVEQCDRLPADEDAGKEWICTVWTAPRRDKPHKALERRAFYRLVDSVPHLKPFTPPTPNE